jgi:large subunit ribosomal protein L32
MVAVPKKKPSHASRDSRHNALVLKKQKQQISLVKCKSCGALKKNHGVCLNCGKYKGVQVVDLLKRQKRYSDKLEKYKKQVREQRPIA